MSTSFEQEKIRDFTVIRNAIFRDYRLTAKAKGVACQLLSLPPTWEYSIKGLATCFEDGESSIRSAISELEEYGYLRREQCREEGKFGKSKYVITDMLKCEKPFVEKPSSVNPSAVNPSAEKPPQYNTKEYNTKELNTDYINNNSVPTQKTFRKPTDGNQVTTKWQPSDNQCETEVSIGKDSIGKDSIGKDSIGDAHRGKTKRFTPPTTQEVKAYINEKGFNVDAEHFVDYYTSNGWKVGRNSMKDWKAAVRTWARNDHGNNNGAGSSKRNSISGSIRPREGDPDYYSTGSFPQASDYWGIERCEDNA